MFNYLLSTKENNYNLGVSGKEEYFGFRCDYLLSENVFCLSLVTKEENAKEHELLKLKQEVTIEQEILNSTMLNITLNGEKFPDLAFYKQYKDKIDNKKLFFKKVW